MNIGLLGGTFNPPHLGHLWIASQILDFTDCDQIWFLPGFQHTFQKPMAPVEHRLAMTQLVIPADAGIHVSTLEIDNKLDGNTIHLLPFLPQEHSYRFIIGSDQLPTFHLWGDWEELVKKLPFLVFPRYGYPNEPLYDGMTMVNDASLIVSNISSTKIRNRIKQNVSIRQFVPPPVEEYIKEKGLYTE